MPDERVPSTTVELTNLIDEALAEYHKAYDELAAATRALREAKMRVNNAEFNFDHAKRSLTAALNPLSDVNLNPWR